jgi:hypothetical protein
MCAPGWGARACARERLFYSPPTLTLPTVADARPRIGWGRE